MRVLVTGHRGYVGSVVTAVLRHQRFDVAGLDAHWFDGCDFGRTSSDTPGYECDFRDIQFADLTSFDAVIHLAALSDDATTCVDARAAADINMRGAVQLAEQARQAGVARFLFASSCAVYGKSESALTSENAPAAPRTPYASAKHDAERRILALAHDRFSPVVLRLATLYGLSPRLRVDTFVNEFAASAVACGRIDMRTDGGAWRPVVHVEDAARVMGAMLRASTSQTHSQVLNVVDSAENHRVIDVADRVSEIAGVPRAAGFSTYEPRSYRVDGARLLSTLPGFSFRWKLERGIRQLLDGLASAGFTAADFRSDRYRRAPRLQALLEQNRLDASLRPTLSTVAS